MQRVVSYYRLAKPGIVRSNVLSAVAGYFYAFSLTSSLWVVVWLGIGLALVIAAACAANNIAERNSDARMQRTKTRELPSGRLSVHEAIIFTVVTLVAGMGLLWYTQPFVVALLALGLFVSYVFIYTPAKQKTVYSTWIGTLPGAASIVAGYAASTGTIAHVDAVLLFVVMAMWQMSHFYSIAIFRRDDYKAARLPVHPNVFGMRRTIRAIRLFSVLFLVSTTLLYLFGSASIGFALVMAVASSYWVFLCYKTPAPAPVWAKRQFLASLGVLMMLCVALIADGIIREIWL